MNKLLTLGSLFDGSGGFPLAGLLAGIVPVWSSEIEPFAIRVTEKRLPQVQHFGNISGLHGAKLPSVDIITFGSPCQDMSIAGKRTGLNGSRSSLFHEAIRIIREMLKFCSCGHAPFLRFKTFCKPFLASNTFPLTACPLSVRYCCLVIFWRLAFKSRQNWVSSFMYFSLSAAQKLFHQIILWRTVKFGGAVLFHNIENLIPEQVCLFLKCLAHLHKRRGNNAARGRVLSQQSIGTEGFFTLYKSGECL